MLIPVEGEQASAAEQYVQRKGWAYRLANGQINLEICPVCQKDNYHFFMCQSGPKMGLWECKRCGEKGNLHALATKMGDRLDGVMSVQEWANAGKGPEPLPNAERLHEALVNDADGLEYLFDRGFTRAVIDQMKIGLDNFDGKKWIVFPYYNKGHLVYAKWRTLPPAEKDFRSPAGRDVPLYNQDVLVDGMQELLFVEGESDTLSCLSNGITSVVGLPGANTQKAVWIDRIDKIAPKKMYLLFDNDSVGQKAALEMAVKLGIEKCYNIVLPKDPDQKKMDINQWFMEGHTLAEFEVLKAQARPFDVAGVTGMGSALQELEDELEQRGTLNPKYITPWADLNQKLGGMEDGDLVGLIAEGKIGKTTMVLNWLDYYAKNGVPAMLYCQEMPPKRLARKWASYVTKTDDTPGRSNLTAQTIRDAKDIARTYPSDLLLGYTYGHKPDHIFDVIRQAVRRYGIKVVAFDNLQLLSRSVSNQTAELNVLGKKFKELAMELNIVIILIIQPNRVKDGDIVAARNSSGSSAIEKDVDAMVCLHRNRVAKIKADQFTGFMDGDENFEKPMLVRVDLSRYASGGFCTLVMEGGMSWVKDFDPHEMPDLTPVQGGVAVEV